MNLVNLRIASVGSGWFLCKKKKSSKRFIAFQRRDFGKLYLSETSEQKPTKTQNQGWHPAESLCANTLTRNHLNTCSQPHSSLTPFCIPPPTVYPVGIDPEATNLKNQPPGDIYCLLGGELENAWAGIKVKTHIKQGTSVFVPVEYIRDLRPDHCNSLLAVWKKKDLTCIAIRNYRITKFTFLYLYSACQSGGPFSIPSSLLCNIIS